MICLSSYSKPAHSPAKQQQHWNKLTCPAGTMRGDAKVSPVRMVYSVPLFLCKITCWRLRKKPNKWSVTWHLWGCLHTLSKFTLKAMGFYYTYIHFLLDFGTWLSFNEKILIDVDFYEGFLSLSLLCQSVIICMCLFFPSDEKQK